MHVENICCFENPTYFICPILNVSAAKLAEICVLIPTTLCKHANIIPSDTVLLFYLLFFCHFIYLFFFCVYSGFFFSVYVCQFLINFIKSMTPMYIFHIQLLLVVKFNFNTLKYTHI